MKLIVNTNRIIAAIIKDSYSRKILLSLPAELIMINLSHQEIEKHRSEIIKKSDLTDNELDYLLLKFKEKLILLDDEIIQKYMLEAKEIMEKIDTNDVPFIAAALATDSDIWSDDLHFQRQKKIKIWKKKDLVPLL